MEPTAALAELTEISSQIETAVLFDASGAVSASTLPDAAATGLARASLELLAAAAGVRRGAAIARAEASFRSGSLVVAREGDRLVAVTTVPDPTSALVAYDLRTVLRKTAPEARTPQPARRRRRAKAGDAPS